MKGSLNSVNIYSLRDSVIYSKAHVKKMAQITWK